MTTTALSVPTITATPRGRNTSVLPTLAFRRLALTVRTPRSLVAPLLTPVLFALVIAPALANSVASPAHRSTYMTYIALATAGLLIPLNCMFSGIGVIVDRQQGARASCWWPRSDGPPSCSATWWPPWPSPRCSWRC